MHTALIIEDSVFEQQLIEKMLQEHFPDIQLIEKSSMAVDGLKKLKTIKPQLVFIDINIPPFYGIELLNSIEKIDFELIVITSYEKNTIQALNLAAIDYLLKPLSVIGIKKALHKVENKIAAGKVMKNIEAFMQNMRTTPGSKKKIALPVLEGYEFAEINDIVRCEADDHYTWFHFANENKKLVTKNLKQYEDLLSDHNFFRVHNSHLINLNHIKKYLKGKGGSVVMNDGSIIDVSVRMKDSFLLHLKNQ